MTQPSQSRSDKVDERAVAVFMDQLPELLFAIAMKIAHVRTDMMVGLIDMGMEPI